MLLPWLAACTAAPSKPTPFDVSIELGVPIPVVPGEGIPEGPTIQTSNNNLDVVRHSDARLYFAFRTGTSHFASNDETLAVTAIQDPPSAGDTCRPSILTIDDAYEV